MRVGIVGCGLNSDYHIDFSKAYPGTLIAGVADQDEAKARECAEKHNIRGIYSTIKELIEQAHPEVVHILTPPKTHYALAKEAIELNRHVLLEKPMTLTGDEARSLFDLADVHGVKLCTMHNHFFDPCMEKAKTLIAQGRVGTIVNVESTYGINTQISAFRDYPHPNVLPWLYELPGGVFHDFMPHPLYVLLEYTGRPKAIQVMSQEHGVLPHHLPDEIRILIDGEKALGTVTFSFAAQPHLHSLRIHGTRMMVEVDFNTMTTLTHPVSRLPKAAQKATHNLSESAQLLISTTRNVLLFLLGRLRPYQGMKTVIHRFYDAIRNDTLPVPVSMEQTLAVIDTMDKIWKQLEYKPFNFSPITYYTRSLILSGKIRRFSSRAARAFWGVAWSSCSCKKNFRSACWPESYPISTA
jgi:predicted dehydrogenase